MATKYPFKYVDVKHACISTSDVVKHLQDELGFTFDCDFMLWDNRAEWEKPLNTNKCYVIMRATFRPEDIAIKPEANDYVSKTLQAMSTGITFKKDVMDVLEKFMLPKNFAKELRDNPQKQRMFAEMGIFGARLEDLLRRPGLFYDKVNNRFGVYLLPEMIIRDMAADPETGEPFQGLISYGYVSGDNTNAAAISWGVNFYGQSSTGLSGVSIDAVFGIVNSK